MKNKFILLTIVIFGSNYSLLRQAENRISNVRNKLNDIHCNLNDAIDNSDIELVEQLMEEFPDVKEFITNFKAIEVGEVVEEKAKEKFNVEKFFNN